MEQDAWMDSQDSSVSMAKERYEFFMRPEPRENLGPIEEVDDPVTGRRIKTRLVRIGMTRNAKEENRSEVLAYLEPFPHIRIDSAKPLQGWYKSLHEPDGVRARPCFSEAVLTEPYGGYCAVGCQFCIPGESLVTTAHGETRIDSLREGDLVVGRIRGGLAFVPVLAVTKRVAENTLKFTLANGKTLVCTSEHLLWSQSETRWKKADEFKIREKMQTVRKVLSQEEGLLLPTVLASSQSTKATPEQKVCMRSDTQKTFQESLRRLPTNSSLSKRVKTKGANLSNKRSTQIRRDAEENESSRFEYSGRNGEASEWTKVPGVEAGSSRESASGNIGVQTLQASEVRLSQESRVYNEVSLGESSSSLSRPFRSRLGLRTLRNQDFGRELLTRFCFGERDDYRGQRLLYPQGSGEVSSGKSFWNQSGYLQSEETYSIEDTYVENIEELSEATEVYDIQTACENFYAEGVLIHNCYINSGFRGYRGTGLITVPLNYGQQIRKQLSKMYVGAAGYFSSFTDPFTPLENYYHNTEEAAREFVEVGLPIFFLSRLKYPDWSIELLQQNRHSYAQKSLNTSDPKDWQLLSPGALGLKEHLADITRLKKAGIYVSIQCNPILPGITSHKQVETLFKMLKEAGADHVIVKFVEAGYSWAPAMVERIKKRFGEQRGAAFEALFTENIGGQRTIHEDYRLPAHERYAATAKRLGLTYATCYEYRKERDESGNIVNSTGVSIGREFTTAEQCHGQRVPVYQRDTLDEPFHEVEACPPSGCLYCAEENGGEARCGSDLLGEASAMRAADYKKPLLQIG